MRLRLFHNAMTTSGLVICGDRKRYEYFRQKGLLSLLWVLIHQRPHGGFSFEDLLGVLYSNGNVEGEHYLGYKRIPFVSDELEGSLKSVFYHMIEEGALIFREGGYHLAQDYDMSRLEQLSTFLKEDRS